MVKPFFSTSPREEAGEPFKHPGLCMASPRWTHLPFNFPVVLAWAHCKQDEESWSLGLMTILGLLAIKEVCQAKASSETSPLALTSPTTYIFFFQVQDVINCFFHIFREPCHSHTIGIRSPALWEADIHLEHRTAKVFTHVPAALQNPSLRALALALHG